MCKMAQVNLCFYNEHKLWDWNVGKFLSEERDRIVYLCTAA